MKSIIKKLFIVCMSMLVAGIAQADVILESATLGTTGVPSGWGLAAEQFMGARFQVTGNTAIECIGGHIQGSDTYLFGAIVALSSEDDLPDGSWDGPDFIYVNLFDPEQLSTDLLVSTNLVLPPGYYGLVFGTGEFGADSSGSMPFEDDLDLPSASCFWWNGWAGDASLWQDGGFSNARFVVANGADCDGAIESTEVRNSLSQPQNAASIPTLANWGVVLLILSVVAVVVARRRHLI